MDFEIDSSWTLFLDRDGVINERIFGGYVNAIEEFVFIDKVPEAIQEFRKHFTRIIVVTNQQGVAKNIVSLHSLRRVHQFMQDKLKEVDAYVDAIYFAPEFAADPNNTRKPKPAMALKAKVDFPEIDFSKSIMVGDTDSDIQFGINLGMKTARIVTKEPIGVVADMNFKSLQEFAIELTKQKK